MAVFSLSFFGWIFGKVKSDPVMNMAGLSFIHETNIWRLFYCQASMVGTALFFTWWQWHHIYWRQHCRLQENISLNIVTPSKFVSIIGTHMWRAQFFFQWIIHVLDKVHAACRRNLKIWHVRTSSRKFGCKIMKILWACLFLQWMMSYSMAPHCGIQENISFALFGDYDFEQVRLHHCHVWPTQCEHQ